MDECKKHSGLAVSIEGLEKRSDELHDVNEDQWTAINNLRNRPPVWATVILMTLSALVGVLGTLAVR